MPYGTINGMNILITGGTRGIGRAIALSQSGPGRTLFLNYLRDEEAARQTAAAVQKQGADAVLLPANLSDPEEIAGLFRAIGERTRTLDALVHSAALGVFKPVHELRVKDWDLSLDVNAKAFLLLAQGALPFMKAQGGSMVAVSSLGAAHFTPNYGAIGISKAALENLVRYLAVELSAYKVRVNAVSGGLVDTDSLKHFPKIDDMKKEFLKRTPGGRIGAPEDLARVVAFLLGPDAAWIVGQTIVADGGYSLS